MGESMVETSKVEINMGESVANVPYLQQSVSFGRFERDSLCWERWSTFPTNKYLGEVEKCSTPGSVAQKKAYFEAHYKQIAARRAELLLDQERKREDESVTEDSVVKSLTFDADVSVERVLVESDAADGFNQESDVLDHSRQSSGHDDGEKCQEVEFRDGDGTIDDAGEVEKREVTKSVHERNDGVDLVDEVVKSEVTEHFDKPDDRADIIIEGNDKQHLEEFAPVIGDVPSMQESKGEEELPQEKVKRTIVEEQLRNLMKSAATPKKTQTAALVRKTKPQKKPASAVPTTRTCAPTPKSPMQSTPKSSKPEQTKVAKTASRLFDKKEHGFTPPSIKKSFGPQSGRVYPTSLHMSLSYGPTNPDTASLTMRKSLIMESMGDKDIVKRAFKAFQNPPKRSPPSSAKSTVVNQSASRKAEQKGSPSTILPKKTERYCRIVLSHFSHSWLLNLSELTCFLRIFFHLFFADDWSDRVAKTDSTRTGLQGIRKTSLSPGVNKNAGADQRNVKSVAASFGPRVQQQGSNQKESQVCKKQDAKNRGV